ncbi:MAG: hypothetical protein ACOYOK_05170 [Pseudobdellovibrionaceae bacterium]
MDQILILHRLKASALPESAHKTSPAENKSPSTDFHFDNSFAIYSWSTCLREMIFIQSAELQNLQNTTLHWNGFEYEILKDHKALIFLSEILCGLHSPVIGETEVFGQFKAFVEKYAPHFEQQKWLQFVYTTVKQIRHEFVNKLGSNSYGSLVRKNLKNIEEVVILGSGHLSLEICPWLNHIKKVFVVSRSPEKSKKVFTKFSNVEVKNWTDLNSLNADKSVATIIAAPIDDQLALQTVQTIPSVVHTLIDLRAESNLTWSTFQQQLALLKNDLSADCKNFTTLVHLQDYFQELQMHQQNLQVQIQHIQEFLSSTVKKYLNRAELRPLGWDDLCA